MDRAMNNEIQRTIIISMHKKSAKTAQARWSDFNPL